MKAVPKINLFLRVTGLRKDGYHEIETLFYPLPGPADNVRLFRRKTPDRVKPEILLHTDSPGLPEDGRNLCVRALSLLLEHCTLPAAGGSFRIELKKSIPVSAGLGGGSSDAAAILRLMKKKYPAFLTESLLKKTATAIGADVLFFLHPAPSIATGIGENLRPITGLPAELPLLVISPDFPVPASWAYQHWRPAEPSAGPGLKNLISALRKRDYAAAAQFLRNDLQEAVFEKFPVCGILEKALMKTGACRVLMSGSGPALFALYPDSAGRDKATEKWKSLRLPGRLIVPE